MRQSERKIPGRFLSEDEHARSVAEHIEWLTQQQIRRTVMEFDERWSDAALSNMTRPRWVGHGPRPKKRLPL